MTVHAAWTDAARFFVQTVPQQIDGRPGWYIDPTTGRTQNFFDNTMGGQLTAPGGTMGWFDQLLSAAPGILNAVSPFVNAPQPFFGGAAAPMSLPFVGPLPQTTAGQVGGVIPAVFQTTALGIPDIGQPGFLGGFDEGGTQAQDPFYQTAGGQPRTRNLISAVDWQGKRRYWVGGVKLSNRWIKQKILSDQRKRKCYKRPR